MSHCYGDRTLRPGEARLVGPRIDETGHHGHYCIHLRIATFTRASVRPCETPPRKTSREVLIPVICTHVPGAPASAGKVRADKASLVQSRIPESLRCRALIFIGSPNSTSGGAVFTIHRIRHRRRRNLDGDTVKSAAARSDEDPFRMVVASYDDYKWRSAHFLIDEFVDARVRSECSFRKTFFTSTHLARRAWRSSRHASFD